MFSGGIAYISAYGYSQTAAQRALSLRSPKDIALYVYENREQ